MHVGYGDAGSDLRTEIVSLRTQMQYVFTANDKARILAMLLNRIGQLIVHYRAQGNEALAADALAEYLSLQDASAQAQAAAADKGPGATMLALDRISDRALALADGVIKGAEGAISGVGMTARLLPVLLPLTLLAAVFVIGSGGLGGVLRARRR